MKQLIAYVIDGHEVCIRPAPVERDWMERSNQRFAYRCLPLNIANAHGWEILCTTPFTTYWDGQKDKAGVRVETDGGHPPFAISHFGEGVLTFHIPCIFQTDKGVDLFVTGPINSPKDGIVALTGIIETDWSPYSFTMNWLFTRTNWRVRFERDEPFCHIFPVVRGELETLSPVMRKLSENPELEREHKLWSEGRSDFNADLRKPHSKAVQEQWQKAYFRGKLPTGNDGAGDHRSRLRLQPFDDE
jgi:Family of unknown function (DUF6065)